VVPSEKRGRALAIVSPPVTIASARDTFLGTLVGGYFAWRATFVSVGVLVNIGVLGHRRVLPAVDSPPLVSVQERLSVVGQEPLFVTLSLTATGLGCGFVLFAYIGTLLGSSRVGGESLA
jgi:predicted MFS family arabinose efflux permease